MWQRGGFLFGSVPAVALLVLLNSTEAAGEVVLSGGATLHQNYDSNIYRTDQDRVTEWTTAFSPHLALTSRAQHHTLTLRYTPSVIYSHLTDREFWDHLAAARLDTQLGERLTFSVADTFVRAEDPYDEKESGIELSDARGRNRYWTNNVATRLGFEYARESTITLSYVNMVLDNDEELEDDYVKHMPGASIQQRFSDHWQARIDYFFTKGNFEQEDDLENHAGDLFVYYLPSPRTKIFAHGGHTSNRYQGLSEDYDISRGSLGFEKQLSPTSDYSMQVGAVFLSRDISADQDAFYYRLAMHKKYQYALLAISGEGGIDEKQFDGTSELDVSRYWEVGVNLDYRLNSNVLAAFSGSFRQDNYWERDPQENEDVVEAGTSLSYTFWRWYTATVRYTYVMRDAEVPTRCYDDNRVFLELAFNKDFARW